MSGIIVYDPIGELREIVREIENASEEKKPTDAETEAIPEETGREE